MIDALEIKTKVGARYGVTIDDINGVSRQPHIARPRHVAWTIARGAGWSLPRIGTAFCRDHSTVHTALRRIGRLYHTDPALRRELDDLARECRVSLPVEVQQIELPGVVVDQVKP